MPRKIALLFVASLMFTTAACDSTDEPVEDRAADADRGELQAKREYHGKRNPAEKLCAQLECSDAQATQIDALFAKRHEGRDKAGHELRKAARAEHHKAIADAFRAAEFDAAVLDRVASKPALEREGGDREAKLIAFASELHAILTPEQRAKLADEIEAGRSMLFLAGKQGKHGKWAKHGKKGKKKHDGDHADRLAKKVDRFCAPIQCTAEQQSQLSATFQAMHETKREARAEHEVNKPDLKPLAAAFRADKLDQDQLRAALPKRAHEPKGGHLQMMGATLAEVHDILTPEQRAIVADKIEAEGLHALMGKGYGKKKGKKGKKKGKHGGPEKINAG